MSKQQINPLVLLILRANSDYEQDGMYSLKCSTHSIYYDTRNQLLSVFDGSNCVFEETISNQGLLKEIIQIKIFDLTDFLRHIGKS